MRKLAKLRKILKELDSAVLAFSGGLDSSFLLKVANDCLGSKLLAVTADSPTYPKSELKFSRKLAKSLHARHRVIHTCELKDRKFSANPVNRCYYCKKELFFRLKEIAKKEKLKFVIDAANISDVNDFRPGNKAKKEMGICSPLIEAGFDKEDIRKLSKLMELPSWDKPAAACLASRIPYGKQISPTVLRRIENAEEFLKELRVGQVRLRHYDNSCRIEALPQDFSRLVKHRIKIVKKLKALGYNYVSLDLQGYRTGSLNEALKK
ncbi:MAG: ATP-dependent sacrificial sulfur transferase LarE [Candidatus Omnitrophica bacterium]|nr:ATP-dependent sacrificial sulfur transferase LarE [Candidatus Omnitrophota bacterium]MDD5653979.1 ATP-dependent sacrificial sulfur transferase LarE [Candidatus Omnitrophota bacterium]